MSAVQLRTAWLAVALMAAADAGANGAALAQSERCIDCHVASKPAVADPQGVAAEFPPRLEGQPAGYLQAQLLAFRTAQRRNPTMRLITRDMSDADLQALAQWFASQPTPAARTTVNAGSYAETERTADRLYHQGDARRALPACATCHDSVDRSQQSARTASPDVPRLTGLDARYLASQLDAFARGWRGTAGHPMAAIARALTPTEQRVLAHYLEPR